MKITVIGTGYVGLVSGTCLAEVGNDVLCLDVDPAKIKILEDGGIPIYEPGLQEMVRRNVAAGRLHFTTDVEKAVHFGTIQFIAVGTPPDEDGSADMKYVTAAARNIGKYMTDYKVVVDKSTVPVGTADAVQAAVAEELRARGVDTPFSVVSNPEFLKEGAAIDDFMKPDRIVVGCADEQAALNMRAVYAPFQRNHDRLIVMDIRSAEPDGKTQITSDGVDCAPRGDVCRLDLSNYQIPNEQQDVICLISELSSKTASQQCWRGLCAKRTGKQDFWNDETTLKAMATPDAGARYGRFTGAKQGSTTNMANPLLQWDASTPYNQGGWYWIEVLPYVKQAAAGGLIVDAKADTDTGSADILRLSATPNVVYRITAVVHGRKPGTQVVLQETYVQQRRKD